MNKFIDSPIITKHAQQRAHERFGIPLKQAKSWIHNKIRQSEARPGGYGTYIYQVGGVAIRMEGRTAVTVFQQ